MLRGGTVKEGNPSYCFLGFCLMLWSLIYIRDLWELDTIHAIGCYFTTLFPHLSAACILPKYLAFIPQILLYHLFLPTKACLDCCSSKKQNPRQTPRIDLGSLQQCMAGDNGCKCKGQTKRKENTFISRQSCPSSTAQNCEGGFQDLTGCNKFELKTTWGSFQP